MKDTGAGKGLPRRTAVRALHPVSCILYLPSVMTLDTSELNKTRHDLSGRADVWLFGYGSLIFKADFPFLERRPASIEGWERPGTVCAGMAYRVAPLVFEHLDVREKNGYLRFATPMTFADGGHEEGLVYIATEDNAAFLGPAPEDEIARHIHGSHGPSGANRDYLLHLAEALRELGAEDEHVFGLERRLLALTS